MGMAAGDERRSAAAAVRLSGEVPAGGQAGAGGTAGATAGTAASGSAGCGRGRGGTSLGPRAPTWPMNGRRPSHHRPKARCFRRFHDEIPARGATPPPAGRPPLSTPPSPFLRLPLGRRPPARPFPATLRTAGSPPTSFFSFHPFSERLGRCSDRGCCRCLPRRCRPLRTCCRRSAAAASRHFLPSPPAGWSARAP